MCLSPARFSVLCVAAAAAFHVDVPCLVDGSLFVNLRQLGTEKASFHVESEAREAHFEALHAQADGSRWRVELKRRRSLPVQFATFVAAAMIVFLVTKCFQKLNSHKSDRSAYQGRRMSGAYAVWDACAGGDDRESDSGDESITLIMGSVFKAEEEEQLEEGLRELLHQLAEIGSHVACRLDKLAEGHPKAMRVKSQISKLRKQHEKTCRLWESYKQQMLKLGNRVCRWWRQLLKNEKYRTTKCALEELEQRIRTATQELQTALDDLHEAERQLKETFDDEQPVDFHYLMLSWDESLAEQKARSEERDLEATLGSERLQATAELDETRRARFRDASRGFEEFKDLHTEFVELSARVADDAGHAEQAGIQRLYEELCQKKRELELLFELLRAAATEVWAADREWCISHGVTPPPHPEKTPL